MKLINPESKTFKVFFVLQEGRSLTASQAKKMGVEQAQNNVRIQETAALETASNTASASPQADLRTRVASANTREQKDSATNELLKTLIDAGDIKIGE